MDEATRQTYGLLVQDKRTTTQKKKKNNNNNKRGGGREGVGSTTGTKKEGEKKGQKTSTDKITSADLGWVRSWHKLESTEAGIS